MTNTEFHEWFLKKFLEWRGNTRNGVSEFAIFLDISQPTVSAWLNKTRGKPESQKIIDKLINQYGDEAYQVLFSPEADFFSSAKRRLFEKINSMTPKEADAAIRKLEKGK